jgi:membrane protein YqaA with SNARE-associated domain
MGVRLAAILGAFLWGVAEATLFVIVPDVLLSIAVVRRGWRTAFPLIGWAVAGALLGAAGAYQWSAGHPDAATALLDSLPAISPAMVEAARADLERDGLWVLMIGAFTGVPYKIFAMVAPAAGIELVPFLLASIPARVARFVLAVLIVGAVNDRLAPILSLRARLGLLCVFWLLFYAAFFALMPR